jgi:hypothetical protein
MKPAVALIPGFLGFSHDGELTYFADRFIAGLRAALETMAGESIDVVPVTTLPGGSLAARQVALCKHLAALEGKLGPRSWHLVGHSTGGLDAALMLRTEKLVFDRKEGTRYANEPLDMKNIASATAIASPHYGTGLAVEVSVKHIVTALWDLVRSDALHSRFRFALAAANAGGSIQHILFHDDLARDLRPEIAGSLTAKDNWRRDVPLHSIICWTPPPADDHPDKLFRDLWRWTDAGGRESAPVARIPEIRKVIANSVPLGTIDEGSNDGLVNTMRQLSGTLAGVVVGDHGDVIGRYERPDLLDNYWIDRGLLTSGADFGDAQFFQLLGLVAACINDAIGGRAPRRECC